MKFSGFNTTEKVGIGIGTNVPSRPLEVNGTGNDSVIRVGDGDTDGAAAIAYIEFGANSTSWNRHSYVGSAGADSHLWIVNEENADILFYANNAEKMVIKNDGKVGIGTTAPSGLLDLYEPASGDNKLRFHSSATGTGTSNGSRIGLNGTELFINNLESSTIKIYTQGTQTNGICIANDGKVGIGSTTPLDRLHVQGNILQLDGSPEYHFGTTSASHRNWRVACQENVSQGFEIASGTTSAGTSAPSDTYTNRFVIKGATGQIQFNSYGGGTHTGTATYKLSVDSSGNVIETAIGAGAVDGAGTANYITRWTDTDTIGNSLLQVPSNNRLQINGNHTSPFEVIGQSAGGISYSQFVNNSTSAVGNGVGMELRALTTTQERQLSYIRAAWTDNTDATRTTRFYITSQDSGSSYNVIQAYGKDVILAADAGKVGIGENAPLALLHLKGGTATDEKSHILFENTAGAKKFAIGGGGDGVTNNGLGFRNVTDDTLPMIIDDSGNVGIGHSAPTSKLCVGEFLPKLQIFQQL